MKEGKFDVKCVHSDLVFFEKNKIYEARHLSDESFIVYDEYEDGITLN